MQTFPTSGSMNIAGGDNTVVNVPGNFFRILQASGALSVSFDDDGQAAFVEPGLAIYRDKPFTSLRLTNEGAAAVTGIMAAIGFGRYDDNRLQYSGGIVIEIGSSISSAAVSVGTDAIQLVAAMAGRKSLVVQNLGASDIYVGGTGVTTASGIKVAGSGGSLSIDKTAGAVWAISANAGQDVRVMVEA